MRKSGTPLTRESILTAAMEIIDEGGIKAFSMRRLGAILHVEAMSLYNHIKNKDDIFSGVLDLIVREIAVPQENTAWKTAIREFALSARVVFQKHPWAGSLMDSHLGSGPGRLNYYDRIIGTFCRAGFSLEQASRAFSLIDSYVYGFTLQQSYVESSRGKGKGENDPYDEKETISEFQNNIPEGMYPYLKKMTEWAVEHGTDPDEDFRFGIDLILSGLERYLSNG